MCIRPVDLAIQQIGRRVCQKVLNRGARNERAGQQEGADVVSRELEPDALLVEHVPLGRHGIGRVNEHVDLGRRGRDFRHSFAHRVVICRVYLGKGGLDETVDPRDGLEHGLDFGGCSRCDEGMRWRSPGQVRGYPTSILAWPAPVKKKFLLLIEARSPR